MVLLYNTIFLIGLGILKNVLTCRHVLYSIIKGIIGYEIIRLICMHLQSNNLLFSNIMYTVSIKVGINDHNPASAIHTWYIYCFT